MISTIDSFLALIGQSFGATALFFGMIVLGVILSRLRLITKEGFSGLGSYVYWVAFPAYLIVFYQKIPTMSPQGWAYLLVYSVSFLALYGLVFMIIKKAYNSVTFASGAAMNSIIPNSAFLGIPLATHIWGEAVLDIAPLLLFADFLILFFIGCAGLAWASEKSVRPALLSAIKNPTLIASLIGFVCVLTQVKIPDIALSPLDLIAKSAVPVALIALGGALGSVLAQVKWPDLLRFSFKIDGVVFAKLILAPIGMFLAMSLLNFPALWIKVAVFLAACPTAISVFIQTQHYKVYDEQSSLIIAKTTFFSFLSLNLLAVILS